MNPLPVDLPFFPPFLARSRVPPPTRPGASAPAPAALVIALLIGLGPAAIPKPAQAQTSGPASGQTSGHSHAMPEAKNKAPATPRAATVIDFGKREFESNCASCHGVDGKGRGPVAGFLTRNPPDLTTLARQNQGILPMNRLYESIEGGSTPLHGGREMPIWGRAYRIQDAEYQGEGPYDAEALVRARILSLLEYLNRLQAR